MIDNKDFDFIKEQFDRDGIEAPKILSADSIMQKLEAAQVDMAETQSQSGRETQSQSDAETQPQPDNAKAHEGSEIPRRKMAGPGKPLPKRRWFRPVVSIAACAALVIGLVPFLHNVNPSPASDMLEEYSSYSELDGIVKSMIDNSGYGVLANGMVNESSSEFAAKGDEGIEGNEIVEDAEVPTDAANSGGQEDNASGDATDHSDTYTQVEGVDEADIVKTDGKYIYFNSYMENQIVIVEAKNGKTKRVGAINAGKLGDVINDMYLTDGKLIVISSNYGGAPIVYDGIVTPESDSLTSDGDVSTDEVSPLTPKANRPNHNKFDRESTTVTTFDVNDPSKPKLLNQYTQTGSLLSSRMIGKELCLVTNDYLYTIDRGYYVPYVCYGKNEPTPLEIGNICGIPQAKAPAYTVIGCIDTESGKADKKSIKTKAVLGGSTEIYCNQDTLYITADVSEPIKNDNYDTSDDIGYTYGFYPMEYKTCILKVSFKDGKIKYQKTATIDGNVNNQFSMDERGGYFKVAATDTVNGKDTNNLYVMDENMKIVGSVKNFAPDEHIEAVRYIKDKAYVITYEQVDPLFIIDLKDPTDPVIEGHVKISGFSTLLVPSGKDHLLGLGFSTEGTDFGEATNGVKLSLFDINDPAKPTVADAKEYPGMDSEVQYNHKALLVGPKADYYAIPYSLWDENGDDIQYGILKFSTKAGTLTDVEELATKEAVMRCIYIGDYLYGICDNDSIESFHINQ